ncbi:DegV family protein [Saxibacter everestensis]|uniref:DegV family protein n=1 Tax=Saxibacter everestensis TaxID=2909229 RepID=A0ABY8QXX8_9MICO|nr:DegV family protein [Brevibacteriaceae bacterium ZFBP1038]
MSIALVTDSTSGLDLREIEGVQVRIVPLSVIVDAQEYEENVNISPEQISAHLRAGRAVSTSRPSPSAFSDTYLDLQREGITRILSMHLSAELSGTCEAARLAAASVGSAELTVQVVDTQTSGAVLGYALTKSAQAVALGREATSAAPSLTDLGALVTGICSQRSRTLFYVATLEYLRRGGRIGSAASLLGSALAIKPLLHMRDGKVQTLEKVRTEAKALARLKTLSLEAAAGYRDVARSEQRSPRVRFYVQHFDAPEAADRLLEQLLEGASDLSKYSGVHLSAAGDVCEISVVLGAHVGPGMLAVTIVDDGAKPTEE